MECIIKVSSLLKIYFSPINMGLGFLMPVVKFWFCHLPYSIVWSLHGSAIKWGQWYPSRRVIKWVTSNKTVYIQHLKSEKLAIFNAFAYLLPQILHSCWIPLSLPRFSTDEIMRHILSLQQLQPIKQLSVCLKETILRWVPESCHFFQAVHCLSLNHTNS